MPGTDILTDLFIGGGSGLDSEPLQTMGDNFVRSQLRLAYDLAEPNGTTRFAGVRMNCTASYSQSSDTFGTWGGGMTLPASGPSGAIDRAVAALCQIDPSGALDLYLNVNVASPVSGDKVPKITGATSANHMAGTMASWKAQWPRVLGRWGPGGSIIGSQVRMQDGTLYRIPSTFPGVRRWAVWNEPNQIGGCKPSTQASGPLTQEPPNNHQVQGGIDFQWYELVFMLNRDAMAGAKLSPNFSQIQMWAIAMGGLEPDFLWAVPGKTSTGVIQFGNSKGFDWSQFKGIEAHCYANADPMTSTGGPAMRGVPDTIRTDIRPGLDSHGASTLEIWIGEGGAGGSLSGSPLAEVVNAYFGTGTGNSKTACWWGHAFGDVGMNGAQTASQMTHPKFERNYIRKWRSLNIDNNAKVRGWCRHMGIRATRLTSALAQSDGRQYWQYARAICEIMDAVTNPNAYVIATGSPKRSSSWLPAAIAIHDEFLAGVTPNQPPDITFTAPATGTTTAAASIGITASVTDADGDAVTAEYAVDNGSGYGSWQAMASGAAAPGGAAAPASSGTFTATVPIAVAAAPGSVTNRIKVRAHDSAGNYSSTTPEITVIGQTSTVVDTTPPAVTFTNPTGDLTVPNGTTSYLVQALVYDDGTVDNGPGPNQDAQLATCTINGVSVMPPDSVGQVGRTVSLAVGANTVTLVATDSAGNTRTRSLTITRSPAAGDTTPPTLTVSTPSADASVANGVTSQSVVGQATDASGIQSVTVNGVVQTLDGGGNFSTSVPLSVGANTITVIATDNGASHLTTTITRTITRAAVADSTQPTINVDQANNQVLTGPSGTPFTLSGTVTDAGSGVASFTVAGAAVPLDAGGAYSTIVNLSTGLQAIKLKAQDNAGNKRTVTRNVTLVDPDDVSVGLQMSDDEVRIQLRINQRAAG